MRSYRICFYSPKGGAGKTTGVCNIAGIFAQNGIKVLIIDTDPSFSASASFPIKKGTPEIFYPELMNYAREKGVFPKREALMKTIVPAFGGRDISKEGFEKQKARNNIFIAPVRTDINSLDIEQIDNSLVIEQDYTYFNRFFAPIYQDFQIILIDAPGQRTGSIYLNAVCMSEYVVSPSEFDIYSSICILDAEQIVERANSLSNHEIRFLGFYLSKFHGVRIREQELLKRLSDEGHKFLNAAIKDSSAIRTEQGELDAITLAQPSAQESAEFKKLGREILLGIQNMKREERNGK